MLEGYQIYDADAHVMMSPRMWETLCQRRSKKGPDGGVRLVHLAFEACPRSPWEGPARAAACPSHG